jgi:polar amino acid transport system substrate-binding protein
VTGRLGFIALFMTTLLAVAAAPLHRGNAAEAGCEPTKIATKYPSLAGKTIKIGISAADKPMTFRDPNDPNKFTGYNVEYARAAFACIGAPIEFSVAGWPGLLPSLVAGQIDIMWDELFYTPERAKSVDFVLYSTAGDAVVVPKGNPKNIHNLMDLCGLRAVSQLGGTENGTLQKTSQDCVDAHRAPIAISVSQDRPSGLRELDNARVDAYLGIGTTSAYDPSVYFIAYTYSSGLKVGVGVRKGDTDMEHALYDAIKIIQADGSDKKIYEAFGLSPALAEPTQIVTQ